LLAFNRDWGRAAGQLSSADSITGRWKALGKATSTAHRPLRCLLTRVVTQIIRPAPPTTPRFSIDYTVPWRCEHYGDWEFNGAEDLSKMAGGIYSYEGRATTTNFH
jgi:hypothetical protein